MVIWFSLVFCVKNGCLKSQISNIDFNTVKIHQAFWYNIKYHYIKIFNNNKYESKESLQ